MYNGIINVYKEKGFTSHDVVAILRGILKQKKIGHTGTLDPEATGVLPICVGKGTKLSDLLMDKNKTYRTTFRLGQETDTQDHVGKVVSEASYKHVDETMVLKTIESFIGDITQIPPMYSAIKIGGRKLYDLAREGKVVERKERHITIYEIKDISVDLPDITMTVSCSKGTYIRTLCRDIAEKLETCGHMIALERVTSGVFDVKDAKTIAEIKAIVADGCIEEYVVSIDTFFNYEKVVISETYYKFLYNGNKLPFEATNSEKKWMDKTTLNVYNEEGVYMGIYEWSSSKDLLIPIKFFDLRR